MERLSRVWKEYEEFNSVGHYGQKREAEEQNELLRSLIAWTNVWAEEKEKKGIFAVWKKKSQMIDIDQNTKKRVEKKKNWTVK